MNVFRRISVFAGTNRVFVTIWCAFSVIFFCLIVTGWLPRSGSHSFGLLSLGANPWFAGLAAVFSTTVMVWYWVARPDRLPKAEELSRMSEFRFAEITGWLRERTSVEAAPVEIQPYLQPWFDKVALPGDELWYYDTGPEAWENLGGENGFALVRGGVVVDFMMWEMN